jgi:hypothetical protein
MIKTLNAIHVVLKHDPSHLLSWMRYRYIINYLSVDLQLTTWLADIVLTYILHMWTSTAFFLVHSLSVG